MVDTIRVTVRVRPETLRQFEELAEDLGITRNALFVVCASLGRLHLESIVHPERRVPREVWDELVRKTEVKLPG